MVLDRKSITESLLKVEAGYKELDKLVIDISKDFNDIDPLEAMRYLDNNGYEEKAELAKKLLLGGAVTIKKGDAVLTQFQVTESFSFSFDNALRKSPQVLKYFLLLVYNEFVKNSFPY